MENSKLIKIENKIIHLSEEIEKLLNLLKKSLEGGEFVVEENEFKYKNELENYKEDKTPNIKLAKYIFALIDNIRKEMNESVDTIYSHNIFEYAPINYKELNEKLKEKEKIKREIMNLIKSN